MLQRKLRQMSGKQRALVGWALFVLGLGALVVGIWFNHYSNFPSIETVTIAVDEASGVRAGDRVMFEREMRTVARTPSVDPSFPKFRWR